MPGTRDLIVTLNNLGRGDLEVLRSRLLGVRRELSTMGQEELGERLDEALRCLERGEAAEYRRLVNHVVSRLGHLKTV
jgi:hypothetical protein